MQVSPGPVARFTLDRPEVRNALNDQLIARLAEAFTSLSGETRAVVLAGNGPAFCAGGDLEWMKRAAAYTHEENERDALRLARLFQAIVDCPAVVIARVHGPAYGGGCGLVAACDVAIASEGAKFAFSEVKLGLVPATISPFVLPKIGAGHARALFTTGEAFSAGRALTIGLVHEVVAEADLDAAVDRKLRHVLAAGPSSVAISKRIAQDPPGSLEGSAKLLADVRASDEGREGVAAFLEKRTAAFADPT